MSVCPVPSDREEWLEAGEREPEAEPPGVRPVADPAIRKVPGFNKGPEVGPPAVLPGLLPQVVERPQGPQGPVPKKAPVKVGRSCCGCWGGFYTMGVI